MSSQTTSDYQLVSSRESKYVGYEPCGTGLAVAKDATREEVERAVRIFRRIARKNGHPNLALRRIGDEIFVMSNQFVD